MIAATQPPEFSIATDLGVQRSFKEGQQFWAAGHTIQTHLHLAPKDGVYCWISYYSNGKFRNNLTAIAKSPLTTPQEFKYINQAILRFKQFSLGWKKYLKGAYNLEYGWSLYGYGGFGILFGDVNNRHSNVLDTTVYMVPVRTGKAKFKRLTLDLGLGYEVPFGGSIYFYAEGRAWIPTTSYPSKYIFANKNAPLVGMFNAGVRVLFD
jgi:hypothetical protein